MALSLAMQSHGLVLVVCNTVMIDATGNTCLRGQNDNALARSIRQFAR